MQHLVIFTALALIGGTPTLAQDTMPAGETKPAVAVPESTPATARDFFLFTKALKPLREGMVTSQVRMDLKGDNLSVTLQAEIKLVQKASGAYLSDILVQSPTGGKPHHYKVTSSGKTTWVQDVDAKTYAIQPVASDNEFLVRGLLTGLAQKALEKLEPAQLKALDAPEPTPELAAALESGMKPGEVNLKVRDEQRGARTLRVYDLQTGGPKGEVISIFVGPNNQPDRLAMKLKQDKLDISFSEVVLSINPTIAKTVSFRYTPTRGVRKVKKIDLGNF
ncbi:hypothetical protein [Armatimonas rosea]|uniref:Outer membrane lipoprotein-sorting protein n=1 Tax=Armatimonas rosea TaxID=685828 RepID=A0A7W9STL9_ARMRO|nr:hypothetical protein [Armatimonas rosea]MBB6051999.1 hypothetical protein [Armatimonas rosea]